jgi:hypothetical protein
MNLRRFTNHELTQKKDGSGDLPSNSGNTSNSWWNYQSGIVLYIHGVNLIRQTETRTADPLVSEAESDNEKMKRWKRQALIRFQQSSSKQEMKH